MKGRSLLVLSAFIFAAGCRDARQPGGPLAPDGPSEIISDGAHGGNRDFFFLPPMVPLAQASDGFELGKFNNTLQPSLKIEICELAASDLNAQGRPSAATPCIAGAPLKTFAPGSVNLVNLPRDSWGWWSYFNLPPDGFYYVLWNTRQSNLNVNKYYRIKVLINGSSEPLGVADVDPMSSLSQWQYSATGEVVQMLDDIYLPIPFRVEKGALCEGATECGSATLTNDNPNGDSQVLQVLNDDGVPIAGVLVPDGWLPADGPQSVVFTIARVNTGVNDIAAGTQSNPCHAGLPLQQFDGCFHFSTIPELPIIGPNGQQFAKSIIGAVCFVLNDTDDPREPYVQLWSSEPGEEEDTPIPLKSADASAILTDPAGRNCGESDNQVAATSTNVLTRFASAGWQKMSKGFGRVFGVKTAYAVDLGLGGILDGISNIGPALSAELVPYTATVLNLSGGATTTSTARVVGTQIHDGTPLTTGIAGVAITYTLATGHGALRALGDDGPGSNSVIVTTNSNPIDPESSTSGGGFAPVNWTMPTVPGVYTLTATSSITGGSVTFTNTVPAPAISLAAIGGAWVNENQATGWNTSLYIDVEGSAASVEAWGQCSPWDCEWGPTDAATTSWTSGQQITAVWDQGFATRTQTITYLSATRLQVVLFNDYTVEDGRTDVTVTEFFERPDLSLLSRNWDNRNLETPGITRVAIAVDGAAATVEAWGRCSPTDCEWGPAETVSTSAWGVSQQITAFWDQGYATRTQTITFLGVDFIKVVTFTDFTAADGRTDYTLVEYFKVNT